MTPDGAGRLVELAVRDLALLDRVRLELGPGLNVLTGETGAGKSLLIDALGLALGARADSGLVRHGTESARVEALFDRAPEALIVVREVSAAGRSTARIDDELVTAARLSETVGPLVEIHGQHDQQRLLDERVQRDLLDAFGGLAAARGAVAAAVERWRVNRSALVELSLDPREIARRLEIAEHEADEVAAARLRVGEGEEIRTRLGATHHAEAIARGGSAIRDALAGRRAAPANGSGRPGVWPGSSPGSTPASGRWPTGSAGSTPSSTMSSRRCARSSRTSSTTLPRSPVSRSGCRRSSPSSGATATTRER